MDSSYSQLDKVKPKVPERIILAASPGTIALDWQTNNLSVIISSLSKGCANIKCGVVEVHASSIGKYSGLTRTNQSSKLGQY